MGVGFALPIVAIGHDLFGHWERTIHVTVSNDTEEPEHLQKRIDLLISTFTNAFWVACRLTEVRPGTELSC